MYTRADFKEARDNYWAVVHKNGSVGKVTSTSWCEINVEFKLWVPTGAKNLAASYSENTRVLTIHKIRHEDYIAQGGAKDMTAQALYEVTLEDGTKKFATKIMEKNKTLWVMEIKGGDNTYVAVSTNKIVEVVPYTIHVVQVNHAGTPRHFEAEEGKFSKGEMLLLSDGSLVMVHAVDTKVKGVNEIKVVGKITVNPI